MIRILSFLILSCLISNGQVKLQNAKVSNVLFSQTLTGGGGGGSTTFVLSGTGTLVHPGNFTGFFGCQFVPSVNMTVTDLGFMMLSGNTHTHTVSLTDDSSTLLAQTSPLATSGQTANTYIFGSVTSAHLTSGTTYYIQVSGTSGGDDYYNDTGTFTTTSDALITASVFSTSLGVIPTTSTSGVNIFGPVNMKYTVP